MKAKKKTETKKKASQRKRPFFELQVSHQIALFLGNQPGTLAKMCKILADAKINIYAISTSDTIDHSVVRLVVDNPRQALHLFERRGVLAIENQVLMLDGSNQSGSLMEISKTLADARVNIEYAYCATHPESSRGIMILRPDNIAKALRVLNTIK